jgi:hypothetical protein
VRHVYQMLVYVVGIVGCSDTHCGVRWLVLSLWGTFGRQPWRGRVMQDAGA